MNYKKISQTLLDLGYIDDRRLLCHSNANVAETRNYGVFMKVTSTYQGNLPRFMILSIKKKNRMMISGTVRMYAEFYAVRETRSIPIAELHLKQNSSV